MAVFNSYVCLKQWFLGQDVRMILGCRRFRLKPRVRRSVSSRLYRWQPSQSKKQLQQEGVTGVATVWYHLVGGDWNMTLFFPYIENFIIPTDFHIFRKGWNHQPVTTSHIRSKGLKQPIKEIAESDDWCCPFTARPGLESELLNGKANWHPSS